MIFIFVKTRTNKHKETKSTTGCGLNNCYSIKCNKQQKSIVFQGQRYVL